MSPLSEAYGRLLVYHGSMVAFVAFVIGNAASQNTAQFMLFRFLSGCAGGTPLALGGGTIADISSPERRALATAFFSMGPMIGPVS
jgi:MFS family permease